MTASFDTLCKILRHERKQGYQNKAVMGGLQAFALSWKSQALAGTQDPELVRAILDIGDLLTTYPASDPVRRSEIVNFVLSRVQQLLGGSESAELRPQEPKPAVQPEISRAGAPTPATPPAPSAVAEAPSRRQSTGLDAPVSTLPGIKAGYGQRLSRLGIHTVGDLLSHYPHRYVDYRTLKPIARLEYGEDATIVGVIWETSTRETRGGGVLVRSVIADSSGTLEAVWFNQPYLARQLRAGRRIVLSGRVSERLGRLTMQSPTWEPLEGELIHTARLVPVYPLTQGISARWMRQLMKRVVDHWAPRLEDHLPTAVRQRQKLLDLAAALRQIHFPDSLHAVEEARHRLCFDEFLLIQLGLLQQRRTWQGQEGVPIPRDQAVLDRLVDSLPFTLTAAQKRCLEQVLDDMAEPRPMSRLIQGDVGSGKTVVAAAAMLMVAAMGKQAAMMAPTEILAEQHYRTITELLGEQQSLLGRPISVVRLTGSLSRAERSQVYSALAEGSADIVVGTHALIQRPVTFKDLALVIVDEQHRFGVLQRAALRGKGQAPHVLVMSATPIPRSLALTVYGDLDISVVDEMPPGRQVIETRWLLPRERERAYAFVRSQVEKGRQAFILYPLIEESEKVEVRAAVEEFERLRTTVFPDLRLGLLHGRMRGAEKEQAMAALRDREIDILVSTSVIEVGIDVPNASVMLIEGADRFGLAQLHQFRGRVGRGPHQSYCLLLSDAASPDDPQTRSTWERLKAIEETHDGFALAEKDLELRGPGDFLGVRQSGLPTLRLASLTNVRTLEAAREEARLIFADDPTLSLPEHRALASQISRFWRSESDLS